MVSGESLTWRLRAPQDPGVDAVEFALGRDAAVLCGPHPFDFTKTRLANGDLLLALSPDGHGESKEEIAEAHILGSYVAQIVAPLIASDIDADATEQKQARIERALGRTLFSDVARMVDVATRSARPEATAGRSGRGNQ